MQKNARKILHVVAVHLIQIDLMQCIRVSLVLVTALLHSGVFLHYVVCYAAL